MHLVRLCARQWVDRWPRRRVAELEAVEWLGKVGRSASSRILRWLKNHIRRKNGGSPRVTLLGGGFYSADRERLRIFGQDATTASVLAGWKAAIRTNPNSARMRTTQKQEPAHKAVSKLKTFISHINKMPPRDLERTPCRHPCRAENLWETVYHNRRKSQNGSGSVLVILTWFLSHLASKNRAQTPLPA